MHDEIIKLSFPCSYAANSNLPTYDISHQGHNQILIADGKEQYQGHPTTVLMPDGKTVFCVWTIGHGGTCGLLKKSIDSGRSWSELLEVPEDWKSYVNCPSIWHLPSSQFPERLVVYAQATKTREMHVAVSLDGGDNWTCMKPCGIVSVMPWTTIIDVGGDKILGMTNARRQGDSDLQSNLVIQAWSDDNGLTWSKAEIAADIPGIKLCEPWIIKSPDGSELACLLRVNNREYNSMIMFSEDNGKNWTRPRQLPSTLTGDRHIAKYLPDGRIMAVFRDVSKSCPSYGHFCAWIGSWDDLKNFYPGQFRIKLLQHYCDTASDFPDCGYPGLEIFDDGSVLATTYLRYRPHDQYNSLVCVKFNPSTIQQSQREALV